MYYINLYLNLPYNLHLIKYICIKFLYNVVKTMYLVAIDSCSLTTTTLADVQTLFKYKKKRERERERERWTGKKERWKDD